MYITHMIRFGLLHLFESVQGKTEKQFFDENVEMIEHADHIGLDAAWLAEHHFTDYGVMPSTQVLGSFIAARTKKIRIGSSVVVLPFHNPIRVAEEFAFLDQVSEGRLDFGVGRGYQPAEFAGYGIPFDESRDRFDESFEIIRQAWTLEEVNFKGKYYQFEGVRSRPRPYQNPHPPFFGASFNPDTIKYQAMKDMNLLFTPITTGSDKIKEYREILSKNGRTPDDYRIGGLTFVYVDEDREKALHDFEEPCMSYFRAFAAQIPPKSYQTEEQYYQSLHGAMNGALKAYESGSMTFEQMVESGPFSHAYLVGDPSSVLKKLDRMIDAYTGLTDLLCWTRLGGLDHRKVMNSMDLFLNKVVTPFREKKLHSKH